MRRSAFTPLARMLTCALLLLATTSVQALAPLPNAGAASRLSTIQDAGDDADELRDIAIEAQSAMERGSYRSVKRNAKKLRESKDFLATGLWLEARSEREGGDPRDVIKLLKDQSEIYRTNLAVGFEYGLALNATGDYEGAEAQGQVLIEAFGSDPRGYWVQGESLYLRGKHDDAQKVFQVGNEIGGRIQVAQNAEDFDLAESLWASGWCAYRMNALAVANARFGAAMRAHSKHLQSWMGLARVFLETDKYASARQNYAEPAIEQNANLAEAYYWQARGFEYRWRSGDAKQALDQGLRANRDFVLGLAHRANFYVGTDQYDEAQKDIKRILSINPKSLDGLSVKALIAATLGQQDEFDEIEAEVKGFNAAPGEFYLTVGDGLASRHRFDEAIAFYKEGIELQPKLWSLYRSLGQSLLNAGDDVNGKKNLQIALENDTARNSVVTRNLLMLLNTYDERFVRITEEDEVYGHTPVEGQNRFRLLLPKDELAIMGPLYMRMLREGMDRLTEKYIGFEPAIPLTVEAFHVHADFEVRTIGIEGLPALGACFGKLITLDSPQARPFGTYNWASTLIHELDHVYQLQMSNGQCPRWLAEGCSVYEERRSRPEWERHMEDQLFQTYASDGLPKVTEFNEWFGDGSRVLFAYYLGSIMVEFIVENYGGYEPIITMITEFAKKKTPDEVFAAALKIDTTEFDKRFKAYVGEKVGQIKLLPAVQVKELQDLQEKAEDGEATKAELVTLARAHYQRGSLSDARTWAGLAQKRGIDSPELNYTLGFLAQSDPLVEKEKRQERAYDFLAKAVSQGLEDFNVYMWLAGYFRANGNSDDVVFYYNLARAAFPTNAAPLGELFQFYLSQEDLVRAQRIAEDYIMLSESDLQVRQWLLDRYETLFDWERVADMALQMIYVNPFNEIYYRARAKALRELGDYDESVFNWGMLRRLFSSGLFLKSMQPAPPPDFDTSTPAKRGEVSAIVEEAKTEIARARIERAGELLLQASALDASHPAVEELKQMLDKSKEAPEEDEY